MGNIKNLAAGYLIPSYLVALIAATLVLIVLQIIKKVFLKKVLKLTRKTSFELDEFIIQLIAGTQDLSLLAFSVYIGSRFLETTSNIKHIIYVVMLVILLIQVGFWSSHLIHFLIQKQVQKTLDAGVASQATTLSALGTVAKGAVWTVVIILALDNIPGIEIGTLITSLGITGIAVGLAVQNILGDLFASLSIALDKPFVIGDTIVVDKFTGTIEKIGLKSTRVRSLSGEQVVFSNSDLLSSRIRNYQRMDRRRVVLSLAVSYKTASEKLREIPEMITHIFKSVENCTFARAHLNRLGESALEFEVVYWVESGDYSVFMDVQQRVNLAIINCFREEHIEFAYPTHRVLLEQ